MFKIIVLVLLFSSPVFSQTPSWKLDYARYGRLDVDTLNLNVALSVGSINDTLALKVLKTSPTFTGRWTGSASIRGTATFVTTGTRIAVYVPGTAATDFVVCTPTLSTVVTTTNLTAFAKTDSLIFLRGSSGTSGAVLNWILIR